MRELQMLLESMIDDPEMTVEKATAKAKTGLALIKQLMPILDVSVELHSFVKKTEYPERESADFFLLLDLFGALENALQNGKVIK